MLSARNKCRAVKVVRGAVSLLKRWTSEASLIECTSKEHLLRINHACITAAFVFSCINHPLLRASCHTWLLRRSRNQNRLAGLRYTQSQINALCELALVCLERCDGMPVNTTLNKMMYVEKDACSASAVTAAAGTARQKKFRAAS